MEKFENAHITLQKLKIGNFTPNEELKKKRTS
jgi:hypothetical protein